MNSQVAEQAKEIYEQTLRATLETEQDGAFVAIEPISEQHFVGETFVEAALAAKKAFPSRQSFLIRIGHEAAFHIGAYSQ